MSSEFAVPEIDQTVLEQARDNALRALKDPGTPVRLSEFYNPESNYAGATFIQLAPRDDMRITATDLLATGTLSVTVPPRAIRRFLEDERLAQDLSHRLCGLPQVKLEETTKQDFAPMCEFYDLVKSSLAQAGTKTSNPWVTASKITARKRPDLFPVRDRVVCQFLGIQKLGDRAADWWVFRELMNDDRIVEELGKLPEFVMEARPDAELVMDSEPLRLLDAALWRFAGDGDRD